MPPRRPRRSGSAAGSSGGPPDVSVQGAEDFLALSKALKAAGRTDLRRDLNKSMRDAAKPLIAVARAAARTDLPRRGGAGAFVAGKRARVAVKTGNNPGVSVAILKQDPRLDSEGRLAHPVFDRRRADGRRVYAVQFVQPGIFSRALESSAPAIRDELIGAIDRMVERIIREGT